MSERLYAVCECGKRGLLMKDFGDGWKLWPGTCELPIQNQGQLRATLLGEPPVEPTKTDQSAEEYLADFADHIHETGHAVRLEYD